MAYRLISEHFSSKVFTCLDATYGYFKASHIKIMAYLKLDASNFLDKLISFFHRGLESDFENIVELIYCKIRNMISLFIG